MDTTKETQECLDVVVCAFLSMVSLAGDAEEQDVLVDHVCQYSLAASGCNLDDSIMRDNGGWTNTIIKIVLRSNNYIWYRVISKITLPFVLQLSPLDGFVTTWILGLVLMKLEQMQLSLDGVT